MKFKRICVFALAATIAMSQMSVFTYALGISKSGTIDTMSSMEYNSMFIEENGSACIWGNIWKLNVPIQPDYYRPETVATFSSVETFQVPYCLTPALYGQGYTKIGVYDISTYKHTFLLDKNKNLYRSCELTDGVTKWRENVEDFSYSCGEMYIFYTNGKVDRYSSDGNYNFSIKPLEIDNVRDIADGYDWVAFVKNDNSLWVYGSNEYGQLGTNGVGDTVVKGLRPTPPGSQFAFEEYFAWNDQSKPVKIMDNVASIEVSGHNGYAIKLDGSLWSWGKAGLTGVNSDEDQKKPVKIMNNVVALSVTNYYLTALNNVAALKEDGNLWVWGYNAYGSLGDGTTTVRKVPQKFIDKEGKLERNVIGMSLGDGNILVSTGDAIYACGYGGLGAHGNGKNEESWTTPKLVSEMKYNTGKSCYTVLPIESIPKNQNIILGSNTYTVSLFNVKGSSFIKVRDLAKILSDNSNMGVKATIYSLEFFNSKTSSQKADTISNITLLENKPYKLYGSWIKFSSDDLKLGEDLKIKAETYVVDGSTYVKMKDVMEYLGYTTCWDSLTKGITLNANN